MPFGAKDLRKVPSAPLHLDYKVSQSHSNEKSPNSCLEQKLCGKSTLKFISRASHRFLNFLKSHFKSQQGQKQFIRSPVLNFYVTRCWEEQKQYKHVDKHLRGASGSDKHPLHRCFYSDLEVSTESLKLNLFPFYFAVFPESAALAVSVPLCFFFF